jgi:rhomboid protease GluP
VGLQTTTDAAPPPRPRRPLGQVLREAPGTAAIFTVCAIVFVIAELTGNTQSIATLLRFGAVERQLVWSGEYWRLATSMFLHIGVMHIVLNTWFGFKMCTDAERALGTWKFLALYLGSGIVGAAVSVIGHDAVSAGASGALFGVIGWLLVGLRMRFGSWRAFAQHPAIRQQLIWIGAWFLIGAFVGLDNFAHGGGMLFGGLFAWAMAADPRAGQNRRGRIAVLAAVGILLVAASVHPLPFQHQPEPGDYLD